MGDISEHFNRREFACKCGCGFDDVDPELVEVVEDVRNYFMQPVVINSACRCEKHNAAAGGAKGSKHKLGIAGDIKVIGANGLPPVQPRRVADYLEKKYPDKYGIGRYKTFTHVDVRPTPARWGSNV